MNEVFQKTRELGEAILQSEEYAAMKRAESAAINNEAAARAMGEYMEYRQEMEELMRRDQKDWVRVKQLSGDIEACQQRMSLIDEVGAFMSAQETFSNLIGQVNSVLRFIVTGEMQDNDSGCTGSCDACGGCHMIH